MISLGLATLRELDTVYGVEDMYDMLEVATVDAINQRRLADARRRREENR